PAALRKVGEFVVEQIHDGAMDEGSVRVNDDTGLEIGDDFVAAFGHGRLIKLHKLANNRGEIQRLAAKLQGATLGFSEIQGGIEQTGKAVKTLNRAGHGLAPALPAIGQGKLEAAADGRNRTLQIMSNRAGDGAQLVHRALNSVEHVIEGAAEARNFVGASAFGQTAAQIVGADAGDGFADALDPLQRAVSTEEREKESECNHADPQGNEFVGQMVQNADGAAIGQAEVGDDAILART